MTTNEEYLERIKELEERVQSLSDSVLMAAELLSARDNEVAELTGALEEANQTISSLKSELNFKAA